MDKGVYTFPKGNNSKINVLVPLEFELAYFETAVQHANHYATPNIQNFATPMDKTYKKKTGRHQS